MPILHYLNRVAYIFESNLSTAFSKVTLTVFAINDFQKPPVWAKVKKEKKVTNSGITSNKQDDLSFEEQQALQKSRQALEAKAVLYEKMAKGEIKDEEEDEEGGRFLVDFHKKIYTKEEEPRQDSDELKDDDIPPPSGPEDEWIDYVDSLGRERRCLRKDLKRLQDMDKDMSARKSPPTHLSEDMKRELMRQKWEQEEEEAMNKPVGPVHYQDKRFSEIRNHGVGYYQFSTTEEQRQEQMKTLDKLREQTMEQRVRTQKLKDKRKAALDARLAKVRERKLKKLKASGELDEESNEDSDQSEKKEEKVVDDVVQRTTGQDVKGRLPHREENDVVSSRKPVRKAELPEWAQHKIKQPDKLRSSSHNDPRSERDQQFAPPSFYYEDNNTGQNTKTTWKESPKLFREKNEINDKRHELQTERRDISHQELKNEHKPREQQQLQQPQLSQPVPPPPGYPPLLPPAQEFVQPPWTGYQWHPPPSMSPPPPHQFTWQPNFPFNVPPPPQSLWQPNIPPWQPHQGPHTGMPNTVSSAHAAWSGNPSISNPSLPGKEEGNTTKATDTSNTMNEQGQCKDRTVPTPQELAGFVAQCRSSI